MSRVASGTTFVKGPQQIVDDMELLSENQERTCTGGWGVDEGKVLSTALPELLYTLIPLLGPDHLPLLFQRKH